jgi:hypothetical protein
MLGSKVENVHEAPSAPEELEPANAAGALAERLATLEQLTHTGLRAEWRRLYRAQPPERINRDLLELAVAWKLQEKALGGLGASVRRELARMAQEMATKGDLVKARAVRPRPGARLIREWNGETHDVLVLDDGFRWRGRHWRSLSVIAREITGTHWSGPRFFGLKTEMRPEPIRAATAVAFDTGAATDA